MIMQITMQNSLIVLLENAIKTCTNKNLFEMEPPTFIEVEPTKDPSHGDYASNIAMALAARAKKNPRQIAQILSKEIKDSGQFLEKIDIAGPGFMNFFVRENIWTGLLEEIEEQDHLFGSLHLGKGKKVQVEFVSANPTGPLHIGHARGASVGDVIANILEISGYTVFREYYINDAGNQMNNLGKSVWLRYLELLGKKVDFPESCYQGDYIIGLAREIIGKDSDIYLSKSQEEVLPFFTDYAANSILNGIKEDLKAFGVTFDNYFSERELYTNNVVLRLLDMLEKKGHIYKEGEASWFKTTDFGDEKDRVVIRKNGEPTYFAADIAYHENKFERGFTNIIDIWGADHHGYIPRMSAAVQALGHDKDALKIILVQLVNLLRSGKPVAMSTRSGEFVTLKEVADEVGKDAARYNFLMRRADSHLDFDLELAKKQSNENPVYYVQYAHARICSIERMAIERGYDIPHYHDADLTLLKLPEEMNLVKIIARFPEVIEGAVKALEPHRLTFYLNDLAALFHSYYNKHKVISDDKQLSTSRLFLVKSAKIVFRNTLKLLGVKAPERM
jgi:arginyl-tRNA synthetase